MILVLNNPISYVFKTVCCCVNETLQMKTTQQYEKKIKQYWIMQINVSEIVTTVNQILFCKLCVTQSETLNKHKIQIEIKL